MMRRILVAAAFSLFAMPALAGQGFLCDSPDGVSVGIPLSGGVGVMPLGATISAKGRVWSTAPVPAGVTEIITAQSAGVGDLYAFDFADPNLETILIEVRLLWAQEQSDPVFAGTLRIAGVGAWPLTCTVG